MSEKRRTEETVKYFLTDLEFQALCTFNGVPPEIAPEKWRVALNLYCKQAWSRVIAAKNEAGASALTLKAAYCKRSEKETNNLSLEAWERVLGTKHS